MADLGAASVDGELESFSLVELAVLRLRREILSGRTDPGERLVEEHGERGLGAKGERETEERR